MEKLIKFGKNYFDVNNTGFTYELYKKLDSSATEKKFKELTGRESETFIVKMDTAIKNMRDDVQKMQTQKKVRTKKQRSRKL